MTTELPPQPTQRWKQWVNALVVIVPELALGILVLVWYMSTNGDRWIGPNQSETIAVAQVLPLVFSAALLVAQLIELQRRKAMPEPLFLAAVVTVAIWLSASVFFSLGLVFMYAGVMVMIAIVSVLAVLVLSACAWVVRHIPERRSNWLEAAAKITLSLLVFSWLLPWQTMRIKAMSPEEKHAAAVAEFGAPYIIAANVVRECTAIRDITGNLNALTISYRRNLVRRTPNWDDTYFDFDYVGTLSNGRITVNIQHLKSIEPENPDGNPPRTESIVGGEGTPETLAFIYPDYSKSWVNRSCRLPVPETGS